MTDTQAARLLAVVREAVEHDAQAFVNDEDISGADLVEWFAHWRERALVAVRQATASPRVEQQQDLPF